MNATADAGSSHSATRCARGQTSNAEPSAKMTAKTISAVEKSSDGGQGRPTGLCT